MAGHDGRGGSVGTDRGGPITTHRGRCAEAHLGCPCRGDETIHEERSREVAEARTRSQESVECPECGFPTTPLAIVAWGNCRACRTAQSRLTDPLRW
jgi:predicted nucleic acid-binding Zn ribbon protein